VTRATAVSSGVEDYYLGGPEASGEWVGAGGGLRGTVNATELDRVLSGQHPATGEALGRVLTARVPGFDLTFSAPKSVSVLFGIGDDELRAVVRDAHDRAVIDALGYMEREAAVTRRGPGGVHALEGERLGHERRLVWPLDVVGTRSKLAPQPAQRKRPALAGLCSMPPPGIEPGTFGLRDRPWRAGLAV
jgi:hypothetical protein